MIEFSVLHFIIPAILLLLLLVILFAGKFGVIQLDWTNSARLRELKKNRQDAADSMEKAALEAIITPCQALSSKWILREADLHIADKTHLLIESIARAYHPQSSHPVEEARIRRVLQAFIDLQNRLLALTACKGIHAATQFRINHALVLSRAWKLKEKWKKSPAVQFLERHRLFTLARWVIFAVRCVDLTFWVIKMLSYILQDIVFKVFLIRWYLIVGDLAIQVYRDQEKEPDVRPEDLLEDLDTMPEADSPPTDQLPDAIKTIAQTSRKNILFHAWSLDWKSAKEIYICLVEDIARVHHPKSKDPLYEARLYDLLTAGVRLSEKIGTIQTYPFLNKFLDLRIAHVWMVKDTADYLVSSQVLAWVRQYKLTYIFKYAVLLFKVVKRGNPALLFKDFALTLAGEGCKRWIYLYLHDKLSLEAHRIYATDREH